MHITRVIHFPLRIRCSNYAQYKNSVREIFWGGWILKIRKSPFSVDVTHGYTHKKAKVNEFPATPEELRLFEAALGPFGNDGGGERGGEEGGGF